MFLQLIGGCLLCACAIRFLYPQVGDQSLLFCQTSDFEKLQKFQPDPVGRSLGLFVSQCSCLFETPLLLIWLFCF